MNNNELDKIGLYEHNAIAYRKVKRAFDNGEKVAGIVHVTGTGKTYIAEALAHDNKEKKTIYLVPSNSIMEHVINTISFNPNLDMNTDFPNLEFKTYQSLVNMSEDEIKNLDVDLLIIDEFHHIGAPIWGQRINKIIDTHPNLNVFGMTAYTIRDRGTSFERDMANPETDELFSNKIVSRYDLYDALLDGVLPNQFLYRTAYTVSQNDNEIQQLEEKIDKLDSEFEKKKYKSLIDDCKKRMTTAKGIKDVVVSNVKKDGKIIYFCPPGAKEGINDIETIMKEVKSWFSGYVDDNDIVFYVTTSEMGKEGKTNRDAFYYDKTLDGQSAQGKLRVMFAINQYNEGVHAPNIDGVIMGRHTTSDIVYYEQLGRALSVNNQINSPVIIDLTNNYEFIKEIENNLKGRIKERRKKGLSIERETYLENYSFNIDIANENLYEVLKYLKERLSPASWEEMYELAKNYHKHNGDLEVPVSYRTKNGYEFDTNGKSLGIWIRTQRNFEQQGILLEDRKKLLEKLHMRFESNKFDIIWNEYYELAKKYYDYHKNLEVPSRFVTLNGFEFDESGKKLGNWIRTQRVAFCEGSLKNERIELLEKLNMRFGNKNNIEWQKTYRLASAYYEDHKNLEVPSRFKTTNGYEYDDDGIALGSWIRTQRELENNAKLSSEHKKLLSKIGMRFETRDYEKEWEEMYGLAKNYYNHYGNLNVSQGFKTKNGIDKHEDGKSLGTWIVTQRRYYQKDKIRQDRKELLTEIGMRFDSHDFDMQWKEMYNLAKAYYEHYGNLEIPSRYTTINGITHDDKGKKVGKWIVNQRTEKKNNHLSKEREELLEDIGMRFELKRNKSKVK